MLKSGGIFIELKYLDDFDEYLFNAGLNMNALNLVID